MMGLLGGDKRKIAQLILTEAPKRAEEKPVSQGLEADFSKAHDSLASDIVHGVQEGDAAKVSRALKQFFQLCSKESEYSEEEGG